MLKITWTGKAQTLYKDTLAFWTRHNASEQYATKIKLETRKILQLMQQNPQMGEVITIENFEIRRTLVLHNFSIFYRIKNDSIQIIAFWDNSRRPLY